MAGKAEEVKSTDNSAYSSWDLMPNYLTCEKCGYIFSRPMGIPDDRPAICSECGGDVELPYANE